jgi:glycosyltransferase involved in cell wall biosynthesis
MIIAINTRFLLTAYLEGYGNYIYEIFSRVADLQPENRFFFILDRPFEKTLVLPSNIETVVIPPAARHPLLWHYWYNVKIPLFLKKIKADLFISPDGFCSLTTRVPQITVVHDLAFQQEENAIHKSHLWYYKRYTPKFIAISKKLITVSVFSKNDIIDKYHTDPGKIAVVYNAANRLFCPLPLEKQQAVKEKYTDGKDYFICVTSIHPRKNIIRLLQAFSIFKKWQKSNMKLVLAGRLAWKNNAFQKLFDTYKYRSDVVLAGYLPTSEVAALTGAAYCAVYPSLFEGFGVPVIEAMQAGIPVITSNHSGMLEAGGDAALFANPREADDIAAQMQKIYKDEQVRNRHLVLGSLHVQKFNWEKSAGEMAIQITEVLSP